MVDPAAKARTGLGAALGLTGETDFDFFRICIRSRQQIRTETKKPSASLKRSWLLQPVSSPERWDVLGGRAGPESFLTSLRQVGQLKGHAKTKMLELLSRAEAAQASLEKARKTAVLCQAMLCLG